MNQVYEQMIGDYNFIYEELKMKHENVEATALVEEEEVAKINEKNFMIY